jgi:hypothetical protein
MDSIPHLNSLAEQKMRLLASCDVQREMISLELGALRYRVSHFKGAYSHLPKFFLIAAPIVGYLAARKVRRTGGLLTKGVLLWTAARRGLKIWRSLRR